MGKFLYVFTQQDRDRLSLCGYKLLKSDEAKNVYIFENDETLRFNQTDIQAVFSDVLTF